MPRPLIACLVMLALCCVGLYLYRVERWQAGPDSVGRALSQAAVPGLP